MQLYFFVKQWHISRYVVKFKSLASELKGSPRNLKPTVLMPLPKDIVALFRATKVRKRISRSFGFLALCFTSISLQPATALCDSASEAFMPATASSIGSSTESSGSMQTLFNGVRQYFGTHYRFGGESPAGFDCSGFVRFMFGKTFNMQLPRSSREMASIGNRVEKNELQPGDLVFFQTKGRRINHVGIFIGNDTFVHSSLTKGITEDKLKQNYYEKRFAGGVRLPGLPPEQISIEKTKPS